jgi:murein DD-endopeptidase MepM/ murein hydrolase activator NlpD
MNKKILFDFLTQRHLLMVRDEDNFGEKFSFGFTYLRLLVVLTAGSVFLFSLSFLLSHTILNRWFNPVSQEVILKRRLIELSANVDSLSEALQTRDAFLANMNRIMAGNKPMEDSLAGKKKQKTTQKVNLEELATEDLQLRREFETNPSGKLISYQPQKSGQRELLLLSPVPGGIVSSRYDAKIGHYGIDLVAKKDETIKCVADGTVILSSWTSDTGHVIAVQHPGNLISVYKHNSVLLKKAGNPVKAGDIIALMGNTGELTTGPHLHFELWSNGNPVNPELHVSF